MEEHQVHPQTGNFGLKGEKSRLMQTIVALLLTREMHAHVLAAVFRFFKGKNIFSYFRNSFKNPQNFHFSLL